MVLLLIGYQIVHGASPAISKFGLGFLVHTTWQPNFNVFGAGSLLFGTVVSSFVALVLGAPIAISIGLFLSLLAPTGVRGVVSPLVEMLAAIPSVILGFWGILVLAPFVHEHIEPFLHDTLGFIPIFGAAADDRLQRLHRQPDPDDHGRSRSSPRSRATSSSPCRATSRTAPARSARPAGRSCAAWSCRPPPPASIAASLLGLGRALGEAIAVAQVIGAGSEIHASLFKTGDTLAARIANQFPGALTEMHMASLFYLGVILLVIGLVSNLVAQWIGRRFELPRGDGAMSDEPAFDPTAPLTPTRQPAPAPGLQPRRRVRRDRCRGARGRRAGDRRLHGRRPRGRARSASTSSFTGAPTGIGPALVGTAVIVAIATAIAMPLGVLIALYLTEFAGGRAPTRSG